MSEYPWNRPVEQTKKNKPSTYKLVWILALFIPIASVLSFFMGKAFSSNNDNKEQSTSVKKQPPIEEVETYREPKVTAVSSDSDILKLSKGFDFKYEAVFNQGKRASKERMDDSSYTAQYTLDVKYPKAANTLDDLAEVNEHLPKAIVGLESMLENAKVSSFFETLYNNKTARLKKNALKLNSLLTRHNFYDCETMLEMESPETKRKAFLLIADMDVVSDGSDGDRMPQMPDEIVNSTHYQPFTSYGWKKTGETVNPMIAGFKRRIGNADKELADPITKNDRAAWLKKRKEMLLSWIDDLERRSYLIAEHDPFIVIPVNMFTADRRIKNIPRVGDYAIVIHEDKLYPVIVGDGGPTFKVGEASLRLAKQINAIASPYHRPVSDLTVSYLVFPGSAKKPHRAPDYTDILSECKKLLDEVGGLGEGYSLFEWENTFPPLNSQNDGESVNDGE